MNSFILFNKYVVAFLVLSGHSVSLTDIFISSFPTSFRCIAFTRKQVSIECLLSARCWARLCFLITLNSCSAGWRGWGTRLCWYTESRGLRKGRNLSRSQSHLESDWDSNTFTLQARPPPEWWLRLSGAGIIDLDSQGEVRTLKCTVVISCSESESRCPDTKKWPWTLLLSVSLSALESGICSVWKEANISILVCLFFKKGLSSKGLERELQCAVVPGYPLKSWMMLFCSLTGGISVPNRLRVLPACFLLPRAPHLPACRLALLFWANCSSHHGSDSSLSSSQHLVPLGVCIL